MHSNLLQVSEGLLLCLLRSMHMRSGCYHLEKWKDGGESATSQASEGEHATPVH